MRDADIEEFSGMLDAVCSLLSRGNYTPNAVNTAMFFRALASHSINAVRAGFDGHMKDPTRGRFVPVPADIIAQIEGLAADDGRPGPEEAWASALLAADESRTVVWTAETAAAWATARPLVDARDKVGARMAFKETYERLVDAARRARQPAQWTASLGFDVEQREHALQAAQEAGRLPAPDRLALSAPAEAFEAIAANAPPGVLEKLRALRDRLAAPNSGPSVDEIERERTQRLKAQAAEKVSQYGELQ